MVKKHDSISPRIFKPRIRVVYYFSFMSNKTIIFSLILMLTACKTPIPSSFEKLSSTTTNIHFNNKITETDSFNYFIYPYLYLGAGVVTADFNNDHLTDIFFTGNMVDNQLYQNLGDWQFKDISQQAGINSKDTWTNGVTIVDINNDGWLDIYTCVSGRKADKRNKLFINNQDFTFTEQATSYGLADNNPSIQAVFFDYDKDGDLDCYVANYPVAPFGASIFYYLSKIRENADIESDHLYRNNGDGTFTDVSKESGIANYGLSLGISVADFNNDGWEDLYVSNDFATPDRFFFNNGDGTFSDNLKEATFQTALFGMGTDAADFNNDGRIDLLQVDMTPKDNRRSKENMASMDPQAFGEMIRAGFHYQYMYNALQLNRGTVGATATPVFSNMAQLGGMAATDWSWAPLFADLDNDGWKDIFITNGIKREVNNRDFHNAMKMKINFTRSLDSINYRQIPSEPIANYAFKNTSSMDGLKFQEISKDWNVDLKGFSHGCAFADLDNDGDLDLVVNNMDQEAAIYRNQVANNNHLRFRLKGSSTNTCGIGTTIRIQSGEQTQTQQLSLTRGYQSAVEPIVHFGLGKQEIVDKVVITWSDGKVERLENIRVNQLLELNHKNALDPLQQPEKQSKFFAHANPLFKNIEHKENNYDDYALEPLLPYRTSRLGGHITVGDANGDGLADFFLGNAYRETSVLYIQEANNSFKPTTNPFEQDKDFEDIGALFFDADNDGDVDLYVVSGGNEFSKRPNLLQDRLYINDNNKGFFKSDALPTIIGSGGKVTAGDYDKDGDLDLFVGGRLAPANYPHPGRSYILENNGQQNRALQFNDVTEQMAPDLQQIGMVTDALWSDYDNDQDVDLIIVGEWMPITFFENNQGQLTRNPKPETQNSTGWWCSLAQGDFDKDGDMDYVAGNLGNNYKYHATPTAPFEVFVGDFDQNKRQDIVLGYYQEETLFPLRGKQCSAEQIPTINLKYKDYHSFATSSLQDIYGAMPLQEALHYQATTFSSIFLENKGNGNFENQPLPAIAQLSSINDILVEDINGDNNLDLLLAGNLYDSEIETPRNDASIGLYLQGDGKGNFEIIDNETSGLFLSGNIKSLATLVVGNQKVIIAGVNDGPVQAAVIVQ